MVKLIESTEALVSGHLSGLADAFGFEIAKTYYDIAEDKDQAIRDLIKLDINVGINVGQA